MHIHTTLSDGKNTVEEIQKLVDLEKLDYYSITDHDKLDSCFIIKDNRHVCGIEITSYFNEEYLNNRNFTFHILAYGFNINEMKNQLQQWKEKRAKYLREFIIDYNKDKHTNIDINSNRTEVIKQLIDLNQCSDVKSGFNFINEYTNYKTCIPTVNESIEAIKRLNGIAIWAHPYEVIDYNTKIILSNSEIKNYLEIMLNHGLDGLESEYFVFNNDQKIYLNDLIKTYNLLYSIGTDYHGREKDVLFVTADTRHNFVLSHMSTAESKLFFKNGRSHKEVFKYGQYIYKEKTDKSSQIVQFLNKLEKSNFKKFGKLINEDSNYLIYEYTEGFVPDNIGRTSDNQLYEAAKILREYHDAVSKFSNNQDFIMCHGDLTPNNMVFIEGKPSKIIDWDSIYIGHKYEDLAYLIMTWLDIADPYRIFENAIHPINQTIEIYGAESSFRKHFMNIMIDRAKLNIEAASPSSPWYESRKKWSEDVIRVLSDNKDIIIERIINYEKSN
jgi:predicted metal-dependent phosphoesterase TrpH/thiamine kinase-like enzyme